MANERILVVDDDRSLLRALTAALQLRLPDLKVDTTESGSTALEWVAEFEYDAVISDIKMPGLDGLALLTRIQRIEPDLPTLLITGHGQHDLAVQALRGGAFDFIQKPIDRDYLIAALTRAIQVRQLRRKIDSQQQALAQHAAELEEAVAERTQQLQQASEAKDQFLAMLAHELRNPLACVRYAVDILAFDQGDDQASREILGAIARPVAHMTHLLDDLLDVSRISRNQITLRQQAVDLVDVLQNAVHSVRPVIEEFHHEFVLELPNEPVIVSGDQTRLEQIVVNLVNNAAKYTEPGGLIRLRLERRQSHAVIQVQDNGLGIAADMISRIFELFSQVDRSLDRSRGGLGIGLTLVQRLVELHEGTVEAHSDGENCGSTFVVRLPLSVARSELARALAEKSAAAQAHAPRASRRVLLVEDNANVARMTSLLLQKCGHEVVAVASDGLSAIDAACAHRPEIIFLDIGIPKMDGYQVARRLRQMSQLRDVTLVALTGYGQDADRRKSRDAGFDRHLVKPVSLAELNELLETPLAVTT